MCIYRYIHTHTHTHIRTPIYILMCGCLCVCVFTEGWCCIVISGERAGNWTGLSWQITSLASSSMTSPMLYDRENEIRKLERGRERERASSCVWQITCLHIYTYYYILLYIHIYQTETREREKDRGRQITCLVCSSSASLMLYDVKLLWHTTTIFNFCVYIKPEFSGIVCELGQREIEREDGERTYVYIFIHIYIYIYIYIYMSPSLWSETTNSVAWFNKLK